MLSRPPVQAQLEDRVGRIEQVTHLSGNAYRVTGSGGTSVLRFPRDEKHLSVLRREQRLSQELQARVDTRVPDTILVETGDESPAFAIHSLIQGDALETGILERLSPERVRRFVDDLVRFYVQTHSVPLGLACEWLGVPCGPERTLDSLAVRWGKPLWFSPEAVRDMRPRVLPLLNEHECELFEDTVRQFEDLRPVPANMVFGHGDMHGYNMAVGEDESGLRLLGVFDLECTGILDLHEDFFRLSLVSEALLDQVLTCYRQTRADAPPIDRDRIATYYRAFLFYLMDGKSGERLTHLKRLLEKHQAYSTRY